MLYLKQRTASIFLGFLVGLAQMTFLAFSSIQCDGEAEIEGKDWKSCTRSLYSQTGLGGMVSTYIVAKLISGIAPKSYLDKHTISLKKIEKMDLNIQEVSPHVRHQ